MYSKPKECSDYTGDSKSVCEANYKPLDDDYKCAFIDNKCIEIPNYAYCSSYRKKDKALCESIVLSDSHSVKCVLQNEVCTKVDIECAEAKSAEECSKITLKDSEKKHCVFYNNQCIEKYISCNAYDGDDDVEKIDKSICEGILDQKCNYKNDTAKGECVVDTQKNCSDFKVDLYSTECISHILDDNTKKCVYENGVCSTKQKSCLELAFVSETEEEKKSKCESAPTSSNKQCTINSDKSGCREVDKENGGNSGDNDNTDGKDNESTNKPNTSPDDGNNGNNGNQQSGESQENNGNNEKNYSKGQSLNRLFIILCFYLLF